MKTFKFKDGSIITASTVEEAKVKHKVTSGNRLNPSIEEVSKTLCSRLGLKSGHKFKTYIDTNYKDNKVVRVVSEEPLFNPFIGKIEIALEPTKLGTIKVFTETIESISHTVKVTLNSIDEAVNYIVKFFEAFYDVKNSIKKLNSVIKNK